MFNQLYLSLIFVFYYLIIPFNSYAYAIDEFPSGVIAIVNGEPISLQQVEALHDVSGNMLPLREKPEVHFLQEQYGNSLYTLIIYTLMSQELSRLGLKVIEQDVLLAENEIKQDYVGEDFEKSLQEEYLDIETWRQLMKQRLTFQLFQKHVLRPKFNLSSKEIEEYYSKHCSEFFIPEKVEIIWYQELEDGQQGKVKHKSSEKGGTDQGEIIRVALDRLPEKMRQDLMKIKPGEYTPCRKEGEIYQYAFLRNKYPAHQADVIEVYPRIELILLEQKMEQAYEDWLGEVIPQAKIKVCPQFQPSISYKE